MELLITFKNHLLSGSQVPSKKVTVKNYLADIRKFIRWFEARYNTAFTPEAITPAVIAAYKNQIHEPETSPTPSLRSIKRYLSSLRKFFDFLKAEGVITASPFEGIIPEQKTNSDPWHIREFKDHLYVTKASRLTIKNYIMDIRQFLDWVQQVTGLSGTQESSLLENLDSFMIEEYKNRLLTQANLSAVSVNRKLSSLRKYLRWAEEKQLLQQKIDVQANIQTSQPITDDEVKDEPVATLSLENLSDMNLIDNKDAAQPEKPYSTLPPIRLAQKTSRGLSFLFDLILLLPLVKALQEAQLNLWKAGGREVFVPLEKVLTEEGKGSFISRRPKSVKNNTFLKKIKEITEKLKITEGRKSVIAPRNVPKAIYAPLAISTTHLPLHRKIWHLLRHRRPEWYKKYHSFALAHYFHLAIFFIFTSAIGFGMYNAFVDSPQKKNPALAALPAAPPRILAFQGRLTDASGTPITAESTLRFAVYNDPTASGSAFLWEESQSVTPDTEGVFAVNLGEENPLPQSIFANNTNLYLGIAIGSDSELQPRHQLATVAYAANAETLQGLAPITQTDAGTTNVVLALDSSGNLTIGGTATPIFQATGGKFTLSGQTLTLTTVTDSNGNIELKPDGTGIIDLQRPLQNTSNNNSSGVPLGAVEVNDIFAILATASGQAALNINQNSTGNIISASKSGTAKFTVTSGGDAMFAGTIAINGPAFTTTSTNFSLLNTTAININFGGAATAINIGASSGTTTVNNKLAVTDTATFNGGATISSGEALTVSGTISSNLVPTSGSTYNLGSSTAYWENAYINNLFLTSTATTSGFFQKNNYVISSLNTSDDIAIGGSATSSAKFQIFGTTGNATTSGTLTFNTTGAIQTTKNQTLTIGGSTTGNIVLSPLGGSGRIEANGTLSASGLITANGGLTVASGQNLTLSGLTQGSIPFIGASGVLSENNSSFFWNNTNKMLGIGTASPLATIDARATSGTQPTASFSGQTSSAALIVDNSGIGDLFTASSAGQTRFVINQNGNVGINTASPAFRLDIQDSQAATAAAQIFNTDTGNDADGLVIKLGNTNTTAVATTNHFISFETTGIGIVGSVQGNGNNTISYKTNGVADFAEYMKKNPQSTIPWGAVLCLNDSGEVEPCSLYNTKVVGVASEFPTFVGGIDQGAASITVGLTGIVATQVSTVNGQIKPGDLLTVSEIPGVAAKATKAGPVIGRATEAYNKPSPAEIGKIYIVVNAGWSLPDTQISQNGDVVLADAKTPLPLAATPSAYLGTIPSSDIEAISMNVLSNITTGILELQDLSIKTLTVASDTIMVGGVNLQDYIASAVNDAVTNLQNTVFAPKIISPIGEFGTVKAGVISPLSDESNISVTLDDSKLTIYSDNDASGAAVATIDNQGNATFSGTLRAQRIIADEIVGLATGSATYITNITNIYNSIGTSSATLTASSSGSQASASAMLSPFGDASSVLNRTGISTEYAGMASMAGALAYTPNFGTSYATFTNGLTSFGPTTLSDTSITGQLSIGASMILADNAINTLGSDLQIQPLRQANLSIMAGLVTIDTDGNLTVGGNATFAKDVLVKGQLAANIIAPVPDQDLILQVGQPKAPAGSTLNSSKIEVRNASGSGVLAINELGDLIASGSGKFMEVAASSLKIVRGVQADTSDTETVAQGSAGWTILTRYETQRTIHTPYVQKDSLIYITATSDTQGVTPYVARQRAEDAFTGTKGSFTIEIPYAVNRDIKINWWVVN